MKRIIPSIFLAVAAGLTANAAVDIPPTSAYYDVLYHWGLINKMAGHANANYQSTNGYFSGEMNGHSIPWGGRIYTVSTSLDCRFQPDGDGTSEEIVNSQEGKYSKPFEGSSPYDSQYKTIYGAGTLDASPETMEAVEILSDMISIFYYARDIHFDEMSPGQSIEIPVRRNGEEQTLYITYSGTDDFSYNGYTCPAYDITFRYTYDGMPDRYPVRCLIDSRRLIPVQFSAKILIGEVDMMYVP